MLASRIMLMLVLAGLASSARAEEIKLDIGGSKIRYPAPAGYVRASVVSPPLFKYLEAAAPPTSRLVEALYTPADIKILLGTEGLAHDTYFMVQTLRSIEQKTVSTKDWSEYMTDAAADMEKMDVNALTERDEERSARLSEVAGKPVQMVVGKISKPQIYREVPGDLRFIMRVPAEVQIGGRSTAISAVCAGTMLLLRNKVLMVYAYRATSTAADQTRARDDLDAVVDGLIAMNPSDAAVDSSSGVNLRGGLDWKTMGNQAVVGSLIALVVCLIAWAIGRRGRKP